VNKTSSIADNEKLDTGKKVSGAELTISSPEMMQPLRTMIKNKTKTAAEAGTLSDRGVLLDEGKPWSFSSSI